MKKKLVGLSVVFLFLLLALTNAQAAILKVGTNWSGTQYADIQSAITAASAGDEIWVEQGTYSLGEGEYIDITKAISLYGGFTGSETSREQRNWTANVTTVDGNNIERCFVTKSTVTIDGFNIINGLGKEANLQSEEGGGGILNGVCTEWNGGSKSTKYCLNGTPGYLTIVNCTFSNNDSQKHGGAISSEMGSLNATNCTFSTNTAINRGGAINNDTDMTIDNCTFSENSAANGGALVSNGVSPDTGLSLISISITDCVFRKNTVDTDGSALLCDANIPVTGCIFDQNSAVRYGTFAARGDTGISAVFTNCLFTNNTALYGTGFCINGSQGNMGVVKAVNCTFAGNTLKSGGKGSVLYTMKPYSNSSTDFAVTNCILWGNDANAIDRSTTERPLPVVSYSDIDNSTAYAGTMSNCIHSNPLFVDAANGDYSLQTASPCINTGTATGAPADDILKTSRPQGSGFDMGAYEYADTDGDGIPNAIDNCPNVCNTQQLDADGDGTGDVCDTTPGCGGCGQTACETRCTPPADADGDGIPDSVDNCPNVCNTQQLDADGDGTGDVCDTTPGCGGCGQTACETKC